MELYERKHFIAAVYSTMLFLLVSIVMCIIVLGNDSSTGASTILFKIGCLVLYMDLLFTFIIRVRAYIHLCVLKRPIAVINDKELFVYSTLTGKYTTISWERISKFDTYHSKTGNYCFPVYINKNDEPHRFLHYMGLRKDCFRFSYTDYPEDEQIIALLNQYNPR